MAITPRTILTSAAPATVAVVSLYFFTVLGTAAFTSLSCPKAEEQEAAPVQSVGLTELCGHVTARFGDDTTRWSEYAWVQATHCMDKLGEPQRAIEVASLGLSLYPQSEVLFNMKGYHQIVIGETGDAIQTLRRGMDAVTHQRSGIMSNNLAWAGLWEPRMMRLDEARTLYTQSLARSPHVCETIHTGLFVEFAYASQASGLERYDALQRFTALRNQYQRCLGRLDNGDWNTAIEIIGAAAVFNHVDTANSEQVQPLMRRAAQRVRTLRPHVSAEEVCQAAMPMADFHNHCVDAVEAGFHANRVANHMQRNQRAEQSRQMIQNTSNRGVSNPCVQPRQVQRVISSDHQPVQRIQVDMIR